MPPDHDGAAVGACRTGGDPPAVELPPSERGAKSREVLLERADLHGEGAVGVLEGDGSPPADVVHADGRIEDTGGGFEATPGVAQHDPALAVAVRPTEHGVAM